LDGEEGTDFGVLAAAADWLNRAASWVLVRGVEVMSKQLVELKCRIARSQLATALDLFLRDKDPVSVQCLACGGSN
jgi:hypothetical protein